MGESGRFIGGLWHAARAGGCSAAVFLGIAEMRPTALEFVTADRRLADAARKEGFTVVALV